MKFSRRALMALSFLCFLSMAACSSTGPVDVRYPTVQQMDDLDVQWGLPKRKPRGTPSRSYNYDGGVAPVQAPMNAMPSAPSPMSTPVPAMPDPPMEAPPPTLTIPDQLR
jgi:hypothetical protein